jgi:phage gp36-like protein
VAAYATQEDLGRYGVASTALADVPPEDLSAQLEAASRVAESYIAGRVTLPLKEPIPEELKQAVCKIAAAEALPVRGVDPEVQEDFGKRRKEAIDWLRDISAGTANPGWLDSSEDGVVSYDGPFVVSACEPRGL